MTGTRSDLGVLFRDVGYGDMEPGEVDGLRLLAAGGDASPPVEYLLLAAQPLVTRLRKPP